MQPHSLAICWFLHLLVIASEQKNKTKKKTAGFGNNEHIMVHDINCNVGEGAGRQMTNMSLVAVYEL